MVIEFDVDNGVDDLGDLFDFFVSYIFNFCFDFVRLICFCFVECRRLIVINSGLILFCVLWGVGCF